MLRSVVLALLGVSSACGWFTATLPKTRMPLKMSSSPDAPLESEDPCWQDLYDDDCSMSSIYSASFVAGKWIKSMPCASSLDEVWKGVIRPLSNL